MADGTELVLTRVFDAPPELVFDAWTDPAQMAQWWGPVGFDTPHVEFTPTPGAAWRTCIRSATGDLWSSGVVREVSRPERLVFTFAWEDPPGTPGEQTLVTVVLAADGGKTRMTFTQALLPAERERDEREGWSECFDKLAAALAGR